MSRREHYSQVRTVLELVFREGVLSSRKIICSHWGYLKLPNRMWYTLIDYFWVFRNFTIKRHVQNQIPNFYIQQNPNIITKTLKAAIPYFELPTLTLYPKSKKKTRKFFTKFFPQIIRFPLSKSHQNYTRYPKNTDVTYTSECRKRSVLRSQVP